MLLQPTLALFLAALAAPIALTQSPTPAAPPPAMPLPTFEVISIKPNKTALGWRATQTPDGYSAQGIALEFLIIDAYDVRPAYRIVGAPKWWGEDKYDIEARVSDSDVPALGKLSYVQRMAMLQPVLADRFKLKVHWETRTEPIYSLQVVKPGLLIESPQLADDKSPGGRLRFGRGTRTGQFVATVNNIAWLAAELSGEMGRMVVDNTGLTGHYNADLHWTPDSGPSAGSDASAAPELSIFTALQEQLGLKLESTKGPVDVIVIDHVERPSDN